MAVHTLVSRLTKAQLIDRITAVEAECAAAIEREEALKVQLAAALAAKLHARAVTADAPIIYRGGIAYRKVTAWEGGRKVTTYKPIEGHAS